MTHSVTTRVALWTRRAITVVVAALLVAYLVAALLPRISSFEVLTVRSGSMEPAITTGGVVVIDHRAVTPSAGQVATFRMAGQDLVTHRVAAVSEAGYLTKGDANRDRDAGVRPASAVVGTVAFDLPWAGYAVEALRQPVIFFALLLFGAGYLVWGELRIIGAYLLSHRRGHRASVA